MHKAFGNTDHGLIQTTEEEMKIKGAKRQDLKARGEKSAGVGPDRVSEWLQPICCNHNQSQLNGCDTLQPGASTSTAQGDEKRGRDEEGGDTLLSAPQ
ncbi:hypothetical protein PBY51_017038 [Eleginops maclovinus]|uniref:Uncharacterized protein n=1 Tax=Eleginops maclovinus TaxID=56733 RepID=A0AAN7WS45_ELEMC|nr:hypothetical protein PBY51_017038 [Eleginops maclovinus]